VQEGGPPIIEADVDRIFFTLPLLGPDVIIPRLDMLAEAARLA
jgi:hypothetical protein